MKTFLQELTYLINKHGQESASDTPDHILANYMQSCPYAFDAAVSRRTHLIKCKCAAPPTETKPNA